MTDEQRAGLAKEHLERASEIIETLLAAGAQELDGARENMVDVMGLLDDLEFEEGNLISAGPPLLKKRVAAAEGRAFQLQ